MICASLSDLHRTWIVVRASTALHTCLAELALHGFVLYAGCPNFPKSAISRFLGCSMGTVASRHFASRLFVKASAAPACEHVSPVCGRWRNLSELI